MNFLDDSKRDGAMSQIVRRLAELEAFERTHRGVKHGVLSDAPSDNLYYGRRNGAWVDLLAYFDGVFPYVIADQQLSIDTASFDFQNIPSTFKNLWLMLSLRSDRAAAGDTVGVRVNNDSAANKYDYLYGFINATGVTPTEGLSQNTSHVGLCNGNTAVASDFSTMVINFHDYANSNKNKDYFSNGTQRVAATTGNIRYIFGNGHYRGTSPITRVTAYPITGTNWKQYSRATLIGTN